MKQDLARWNETQRKSRLRYADKLAHKAKKAPRTKKVRRKRSDRVKWKNKAIKKAKAIVRLKGVCEWCGKTKEQAQMQGSHIYSVRHEATCAMVENILCLCAYCHLHRWHETPSEAHDWFDAKWPGRRMKLRALAETTVDYTAEDWKRIYETL